MALLSHRKSWSFAVLLSIFPCVFNASSTSDPPLAQYRTGSSEVRITFFVTNENDRLVDTVGQDDFAVVDGGLVIRDFRSLARSSETVLDIAVLADASESVARSFPAISSDVLQMVGLKYEAYGDNISVVTFSGLQARLLCSSDCRIAAGQKLGAVHPSGSTPLFDALVYTADFMSKRRTPGVRQIMMLFSDGNDTISAASARDAVDAVVESGAVLYTINLAPPGEVSPGSSLLQQMAEATGGRSFSLRERTANVLEAVLAEQRSSFVVTYQLPNRTAGFHSLRILPKHNLKLRFHCRKGYYYEENR